MRTRALIVLMFAAGCAGLRVDRFQESPGDWTTEGGSGLRTNAVRSGISLPLRPVWEYNAQAGIRAMPLVRDSIVVVATLNGELQAVELNTGKRIGYKTFESAIVGTPALSGPSVILTMAGKSETVISYNLVTGKKNWGFQAGPVESSPLVAGDRVYVTTVRGDVFCLRGSTGEKLWVFESAGKNRLKGFRSSPSTDGRLVVFGSDDGTLHALDGENGSVVWKRNTGASIFASPVLVGETAIVGNLKGTVVAAELKGGEIRWRHELGSPIYAPAATNGAAVFISAANGTLSAFDLEGRLKWRFSAKAVLSAPPLITDTVVFVGSMDHVLYALDAETGKEVWRYTAEGRIRVSPVPSGDGLIVTSEDKYVTLLRP